MKQKLLFLGLLFSSLLTFGQTNQGFESETFPPQGWTMYHLLGEDGNTNGWSRMKQPTPGAKDGGGFTAQSLNGRLKKDADSWLITPAIQAAQGDFLNFQLTTPNAYENTKDTFDILVSETTTGKDAFITRLLRLTPTAKVPWSNYSIDLSAFAGKRIYIAFRDHLLKPANYTQGCEIYLDNVSVSKSFTSDLSVSSLMSPFSGCADKQAIELNVVNNGKQVNKFSVCYLINNGQIVKEEFDTPLGSNESRSVVLTKIAEFAPGSNNKFKIWTECSEDINANNDTVTSDIIVGSQIPFPYDMSKSVTVGSDFKVFGSPIRWQYAQTTVTAEKAWVYTGGSRVPTLASGCIELPKGKIRISFDYVSQGNVILRTFITSTPSLVSFFEVAGDSKTLVGDSKLHSASFSITVQEDGLQSIGFRLLTPPDGTEQGEQVSNTQFIITNLKIEKQTDDLILEEIVSPRETPLPSSDQGREIKVTVSNIGINEQKDFSLCYQVNGKEPVKEKFTGILKENETVHYAFISKPVFTQEGKDSLRIWLEPINDPHPENDSIGKPLYIYHTQSMPYAMSFEDNETFDSWAIENTNGDLVTWTKANAIFKGEKAAFLASYKDKTNDDRLITPAIKMPAGKARISFFYLASSPAGTMNMEVLMGKSTHPDSLKTILFSQPLTNTGWLSGYAPVEITQEGEYYFAFRAYGVNAEVLIDDIRIDTAIDACITSVGFVQKSGYNLDHSAIKLAFTNNSAQSIHAAKLSYRLNNGELVSETITATLQPGEEYEHIFAKKADISTQGAYKVSGSVEVKNDIEEINNGMSATLEHYKNKQLPYFQDFENSADRLKWQATQLDLNKDANSWIAAGNLSFTTYSGSTCLYYNSDQPGDDWIFSECIEIPAGESELSFFYCTYKNFADRKESFKVMLGTSPDPESMTTTLVDLEDVSAYTPQEHVKVMSQINLSEGGKYYLGFYTYSKVRGGYIAIDDISLKSYKEEPPFYQSDFTNRFDEWTRYKLLTTGFDQWTAVEEAGKDSKLVQLKTFKTSTPGMFASPGFRMEEGKPIKLEMEYALITTNPNDRMGLYMGNENHPDSLTTLIEKLPGTTDWTNYVQTVTVDKTGRYFFAIKPEKAGKEKGVLYKLAQFKLTPEGLNRYELKGRLLSDDGVFIDGATISLQAGQPQSAVTNKEGSFLFAEVLEQQTYTLTVTVNGFQPYNQIVMLDGKNLDLGEIRLKYILSAPVAIKAAINEKETAVNINWMVPGTILEYKYDDGTPFGQVGFNDGTASDVVGSVFRTPAIVTEASWYTTQAGGPHERVNLYILDLDKEGAPTNKVLYSVMDVANQDLVWTTYQMPEPVNAPNGFMVALSYTGGSIGLALDDGLEDYPFNNNTCYLGNIETGEFLTLESQGGKSSYLLRAKGIPSVASSVQAKVPAVPNTPYRLYRFESKDKDNESLWTLLTPKDIAETEYTDRSIEKAGDYQYAVKSVYPSGEASSATLSNVITLENGLSIEQESLKTTIWPVPTGEWLTISSPVAISRYRIYNATGNIVADQNLVTEKITIPVNHLAPGTYYISLYTQDGQTTHKFIKL